MTPNLPRPLQALAYERAAQEYLRNLPPEHFMEAIPQATQRAITLASLALVKARRKDLHVFNELLVQYPRRGQRRLGQVVPDNLAVLSERPPRATGSFDVPLEPAPPFWVMEYVSKGNPRKDYDDSFRKYERELKVPYYLIFYPDEGELTLYRHNKRKYVTVKPNAQGRYAIPELEMEVGLVDGWVRNWYQGELLPLPEELRRDLDEARRRAEAAEHMAAEERRRAEAAERQAAELAQRLEAAERELAELRARRG
jgi:Uma2 family endonuclease